MENKIAYVYLKSYYYYKHLDMRHKNPIEFDPYYHSPKYVGFYILINETLITDNYYLIDKPSLEGEFELKDDKYYSIKAYRLIDRY